MKINVTENKVSIKEEQILNENEYNIHKIQFDFSSEYTDDLVKVALFSIDNHTYKKIISNNECDIPPEVLTQRGYSILGVYAYKTEQDTLILRYSPSPTRISVYDGSYKADAENSEPITPSELEQYQQIIQNSLQQFQNQYNVLVEETEGDIQAIEDELQRKVDEGYFDGKDAKINGKNSIEIEAGNNITIDDTENGIRINSTGGGSGGTSNYNDLSNKPKINNVELNGNKSLNDLGIQSSGNYALKSEIPTKTSELTNDSGFITGYIETDPTVPNHVKNILQNDINNWNNKSDFSGNYNDLTNKPKINNIELVGNKTLNDLGIVTLDEFYKAFPTDTTSGAVASFTDGADNLPLKSLVVNIDPVQDLSHGDPSPENVCPISGWTGAQVVRTGENLLPMEIQISWQTEAGTVYGGKLDVLTGKLTVDMAMPSLDEGTIYRDNDTYKIWRVNNLPRSVSVSGGRAISNITKSFGNVSSTALETKIQFPSGNQQILFASIPTDFNITDVQVAYELATPIEIQLDPHEINTLLGVNNIWADTGDTEVEYRADTKLYINKMIGNNETISTRLASGGSETALYKGAINPIETNIPLEEEGVEYEEN